MCDGSSQCETHNDLRGDNKSRTILYYFVASDATIIYSIHDFSPFFAPIATIDNVWQMDSVYRYYDVKHSFRRPELLLLPTQRSQSIQWTRHLAH